MSIVSTIQGKEEKTDKSVMVWAALNGWSMFILSYLGIYLLAQAASVLVASLAFGINTTLHFDQLEFLLQGKTWTPRSVVPVFLASPVLAFVLGMISLRCLVSLETKGTVWKQFFFWGFLHGMNLSIGTLISGAVTNDGIWYSLRWLSFPDPLIYGLAGLAFFILLGIGYLGCVLLFMSCDSLTLMKESNRPLLLKGMLLLPWFFGSVAIFLLKDSLSNYDAVLLGSFLLLLLPIYSRGKTMLVNDNVIAPRRTFIAWEIVIAVVVLSLMIKIFL
ncbi:hypothetical protein [Rufibacter psychrotolerans]|uniref:hypothetical protein n=1 Tax=Rufibacter psychrotolerans TaxID=2812556 RepID=UPI001967253B|nr:hypothetical protein [Rufibacter sp. SYSU D00308]